MRCALCCTYAFLFLRTQSYTSSYGYHGQRHSHWYRVFKSTLILSADQNDWDKWEFGSFAYRKDVYLQQDSFPENTEQTLAVWKTIADVDIDRSIVALSEYSTPGRLQRFHDVLSHRTDRIRIAYENPTNANNIWAALRTFDAFGIQFVDVVIDSDAYSKQWRREAMTSALGTQKWMSLEEHRNTTDCLTRLKAQGYRIVSSDLDIAARPLAEALDVAPHSKAVIVFGNEKIGISDEVRRLSDDFFFIPMKGFAESLNLAAASAVVATSLQHKGLLEPNIDDLMKKRLFLMWLSRSVVGSPQILRKCGIDVSNQVYDTIGAYTTRP